jgi:hypothetical protein
LDLNTYILKVFLDKIAKDLGIKWIKVKFRTVKKEDVCVCPMPPPSCDLFYNVIKYE